MCRLKIGSAHILAKYKSLSAFVAQPIAHVENNCYGRTEILSLAIYNNLKHFAGA